MSGNLVLGQEAVAALQRQDYKGAEQKFRAELKLHPDDTPTLSLLCVALDGQRRFSEAGEVHRRAVALAPGLPEVLDNYANNLMALGDEKGAEATFLKSIALNPAERNANLQLSRLALNRKDGREGFPDQTAARLLGRAAL